MIRALLVLAALLAFPVLEAWLLFRLGERFGWWVIAWLVFAAGCGVALIRMEKLVWALRIAGSLRRQRSPIGALLASARSVVAGLLLIFPGVITDVLAILLLLWPLPPERPLDGDAPQDVIEGEFRREPTDRLPPRA
ncbi:MAG: FxsA family protein [Burkholderiales bacterium]|nr:FxsA family protein [Burkholderiales bacterium]